MCDQHQVATSALEWNGWVRAWAKRCQARAEQFSCLAGGRVLNWGRISNSTWGGWYPTVGSPVELPLNWDKLKHWRIAGPWVEGEDNKSITTHVISGVWDNSRGSVFACVARDASDKLVITCDLAREGGRAGRLRDNMSLS
jgi:hypothetical protein